MNQVTVIGMGPGKMEYVTEAAMKKIKEASYITGTFRLLEEITPFIKEDAQCLPLKRIEEALAWVDEKQRKGDTAVLVSGDSLYYSLAGTIKRSAYDWHLAFLPGISSYQLMAARCQVTLEDAGLYSVHGRNETAGYVISHVAKKEKSFFLCSQAFSPQRIAACLCDYGMEALSMCIGSYLGQEKEFFLKTTAKEARNGQYAGFSVVYVENPGAKPYDYVDYLTDEDFIRGKVPMTKEEVRLLVIHKMQRWPKEVIWDLGAGTGSISIELARHNPQGQVYAVEYKEAAVELIQKNKDKFGCHNLTVVKERMKEAMEQLPAPDQVFFGGNEGELGAVVEYLKSLKKKIHIVMTAVTMETLAEFMKLFGKETSFSYMQVQIGQSKMVGSYHATQMNHPIWIMEVEIG